MCSTAAKKQKILVVDDDLLALFTLTSGLAKAGYEVLEADNADDAILLAHHLHPDLAVLDLRLQARSGFDVAHYLREHMHTPFLFISASADAATLACAREQGAAACLSKQPLDLGQILPTLRAAG